MGGGAAQGLLTTAADAPILPLPAAAAAAPSGCRLGAGMGVVGVAKRATHAGMAA
mgnify:CR=1 FL=1